MKLKQALERAWWVLVDEDDDAVHHYGRTCKAIYLFNSKATANLNAQTYHKPVRVYLTTEKPEGK